MYICENFQPVCDTIYRNDDSMLQDSDSVKQEIDLVSTLGKFNQDSVPELIECVVKTEGKP